MHEKKVKSAPRDSTLIKTVTGTDFKEDSRQPVK